MIDSVLLQTAAENATEAAGSSLARSLYKIPVTIGLSGALGSGKTAFMRGFLRALGVTQPITSPTYALEQRYGTPQGEVVHIDLYRLEHDEAMRLLLATDHHEGIRCIEWPERAGERLRAELRVTIEETGRDQRTIAFESGDVDWPDDDTIDAWRAEVRLPANIAAHCDAVAAVCERTADALLERGTFVRRSLVRAAGRAHDLFRFWDFRPEAAPPGFTSAPDARAVWDTWTNAFDAANHEEAAAAFLRERGFPAVASVAGAHSVHLPVRERTTVEQHILYYADKRVINDRFVSIADRYEDFAVRYRNGVRTPENARWEQDARDTERLLFPDGAPL